SGQSYAVTPTFTDPGYTLAGYVVTWGDGSADSTYTAGVSAFTHTYANNNAGQGFGVTVNASSDDGNWRSTFAAAPRVAAWPYQDTVALHDEVWLTGSFHANNDTPTAWRVAWGDGTTA